MGGIISTLACFAREMKKAARKKDFAAMERACEKAEKELDQIKEEVKKRLKGSV